MKCVKQGAPDEDGGRKQQVSVHQNQLKIYDWSVEMINAAGEVGRQMNTSLLTSEPLAPLKTVVGLIDSAHAQWELHRY